MKCRDHLLKLFPPRLEISKGPFQRLYGRLKAAAKFSCIVRRRVLERNGERTVDCVQNLSQDFLATLCST